ncbi:MAG: hypothetical protein DIU68_002400 [Chloroflexota bacterium]
MTRATTAERNHLLPLGLILGAFVVLALIYAWATPPLEASDELWHFGMVDVIADTGALPVQVPGVETAWEQEGSQPPLYYALGALLVRSVDRSDFDNLREPNPHAKAGIPGASDNKNLVLHDTPHPPLQGTALAVYLLRGLGVLLGCITVVAVYNAAWELASRQLIALVAAGITAFNPMFLFISASVNNDNLVTALNSLILWQMLVMLRRGFSPWRSLALAVLIMLSSLSKLSGLVLVPVVALAGLWIAWQRRDVRGLFVLGGLMAVVWLVGAGWWYARNLTLYGELFGTQTMVAVAGPRLEPFTLVTLLEEFEGFRVGYWGWFGAVNITTFPGFYRVMDAVVILALVGLLLWLIRHRRHTGRLIPVLLLALVLVTGSIALIGWTAQTYASQGRLLFPYVAATSPLLALGLDTLLRRLRDWLATFALAGVGLLAAFAFVVPFASIAPQYTPPLPLNTISTGAKPVYARFGDVALIAYETPDRRYEPGDNVPITVYWQVLEQSERDLSLYLHAVDAAGDVIGRIDTFPGAGRLRTTTWEPGAIYADFYQIPLDEGAQGRSQLRVQVGWWHFASGEVIAPEDENGTPLESVMLDAGGFAGPAPEPEVQTLVEPVRFGGVIDLTGYTLDENQLTLAWRAAGTPQADYTVFVQVLDAGNRIVGQGDAPPDLPTRYWRSGDDVTTEHTITYQPALEAGEYRLMIGWYRPDDFSRLETASPDNAYELARITR